MSCCGRRFCVLSSCQGQMSVSCQHFGKIGILLNLNQSLRLKEVKLTNI